MDYTIAHLVVFFCLFVLALGKVQTNDIKNYQNKTIFFLSILFNPDEACLIFSLFFAFVILLSSFSLFKLKIYNNYDRSYNIIIIIKKKKTIKTICSVWTLEKYNKMLWNNWFYFLFLTSYWSILVFFSSIVRDDLDHDLTLSVIFFEHFVVVVLFILLISDVTIQIITKFDFRCC